MLYSVNSEKEITMFLGGNLNDRAYSASPTNTARSQGKQVRSDDGFHTRPPRSRAGWRRNVTIALAVILVLVAIFVLRATGDRDDRLQDTDSCTLLYDADVCELLEAQTLANP